MNDWRTNFWQIAQLKRDHHFCYQIKFSFMIFNAFKYVQYLKNWQVLICLYENCRYCLKSNEIKRHFRRNHDIIYDLHIQQQIVWYEATLILRQFSNILISTNMSSFISKLKVWKNEWQCKECFKVNYVISGAKQHYKSIHDWKSKQDKNSS